MHAKWMYVQYKGSVVRFLLRQAFVENECYLSIEAKVT